MTAAEVIPMRKHQKQIEALNDNTRFKFWLAGRRGGKTVGIVEDILEGIASCPTGGEIFYIGPTNSQAIELIWEKVEERLEELKWKYKPRISKQRFEFSRTRKLYIIGAEKIRRIRGHKVWRVYLDEVAFFSVPMKEVWKAARPALSDLRGRAIIATTPNGKGTDAYEFYQDVKGKENWRYFQWFTEDNPYIDPEELEAAKRELDEKSYNQEYRASWESYEGLAYYNFEESLHERSSLPLDLSLPVILSYDFNVNPTTLVVSQRHGRVMHFKTEFSQKRGSTEDTTKECCEFLLGLIQKQFTNELQQKAAKSRVMLKVRGDATGNAAKSNTGKSDYFYIKKVLDLFGFPYQMEVPSENPPIIDRVKHFNSYLKSVEGEVRILVDPKCKELLRDLSSQETDGRYPSDKNNLGHKADAAGYCIYWEFKHGDRPAQAPQLIGRI